MTIQKRNYKEDFKLLVDLGENYDGEDFELNFWVGSQRCNTYTCSYLDGEYTNCEMADDTNVLCYFDNHGLGTGILFVEIVRYVEDDSMPDGDLKLVTCQRVECTSTDETSETVTTDTSLGGGVYYYGTPVSLSAGETIVVTGSAGWNYLLYEDESTSNIVELASSEDDLSYTATEDIDVYVGSSYSTYEELTYTVTGETTTYNIKLDLWESDTEDMSATVLALLAPVIKGEPGSSEADGVSYDNTTSELTADNVQDAIDELDATIDTNTTNITNLGLNVGDLTDLTTTDQSSIVAAINEVDANADANADAIGTLSDLTTSVQTDLVSAINEVDANTDDKQDALVNYTETSGTSSVIAVEDATLSVLDSSIYLKAPYINQTISSDNYIQFTEGILQIYSESVTINGNEVATSSDISTTVGTLTNLTTTDQSSIVAAINEVDANADANADAIGTLSDLTTSVQTDLVSAINEVASSASGAAEDITYDNTSSGLTATDVQAAIDELAENGGSTSGAAEDITYDNTTSGLTATDVQAAIDEVDGNVDDVTTTVASHTTTLNTMSTTLANVTDTDSVVTSDLVTQVVANTAALTKSVSITDYDTTSNKYIDSRNGGRITNASYMYTDYIDISAYSIIDVSTIYVNATIYIGGAFYDEDYTYISGIRRTSGSTDDYEVLSSVEVPSGAVYLRTSRFADESSTSEFTLIGYRGYTEYNEECITTNTSNIATNTDAIAVLDGSAYDAEITTYAKVISDGTISTTYNEYDRIAKVKVDESTSYVFNNGYGLSSSMYALYAAYYDDSDTLISVETLTVSYPSEASNSGTSDLRYSYLFSTPSGASYAYLPVSNTSTIKSENAEAVKYININNDNFTLSTLNVWVLGDSISATGYNAEVRPMYAPSSLSLGGIGGWISQFLKKVATRPLYWVNAAAGGYTLADDTDDLTDTSFLYKLNEAIDLYDSGDYPAPDILMIVGCTNDFDDTSHQVLDSEITDGMTYNEYMEETFISTVTDDERVLVPLDDVPKNKLAGAIRYIVETTCTKFPDCKIVVVTPSQSTKHNPVNQMRCVNEMKWMANRLSIPVIDVWCEGQMPMLWDFIDSDGNENHRFLDDRVHTYDSGSGNDVTGYVRQGEYIARRFSEIFRFELGISW